MKLCGASTKTIPFLLEPKAISVIAIARSQQLISNLGEPFDYVVDPIHETDGSCAARFRLVERLDQAKRMPMPRVAGEETRKLAA